MIVRHKLVWLHQKNEIISKFDTGGISSKISFFERLFEEARIRLNNNQNIFCFFTNNRSQLTKFKFNYKKMKINLYQEFFSQPGGAQVQTHNLANVISNNTRLIYFIK